MTNASQPPRFSDAEAHLTALITAALAAADPAYCVREALALAAGRLSLPDGDLDLGSGRVFLVSAGKASQAMAGAACEILGDRLAGGIVIAKETANPQAVALPAGVVLHLAGHPVANAAGVAATRAVARLLADTSPQDVVLCLISGGASALLTDPRLPLAQWQALTHALLESGCDIEALNSVRRRLDRVKGGGLAQWAAPARCVSLILSDVVGNPLPAIGSGPTVPNPDAPDAALRVLQQFSISARLPGDIWAAVTAALATPGDAPPPIAAQTFVIGDVALAAQAAAARAAALGFSTELLTTTLIGEARNAGVGAVARAVDAPAGVCLIWAGETTVTVRGSGRGGRNQEAVLAAIPALDRSQRTSAAPRILLAALATDGEDRLPGVGGAWATDMTAAVARRLGLDPIPFLEENDSYGFFSRLPTEPGAGGLLRMPPSGTNVNDLLFVLTYVAE